MHWRDHHPFLIYQANPAAARDRVVGSALTFDEARAAATRMNLAALKRDGAPVAAPFVFFYAAGKNGVNPCPVRDPDERFIVREGNEHDHQEAREEATCN